MDLVLEIEFKADVIHEDSEDYYVGWVKKDKATRKKYGLTLLYNMGW